MEEIDPDEEHLPSHVIADASLPSAGTHDDEIGAGVPTHAHEGNGVIQGLKAVLLRRDRGHGVGDQDDTIVEHELNVESLPAPSRDELEGLLDSLKEVGYKRVNILVVGKPGVGKSALVNHLVGEHVVAVRPGRRSAIIGGRSRGPLFFVGSVLRPILWTVRHLFPAPKLPLPFEQRKRSRVEVIARKMDGLVIQIIDAPGSPLDGGVGDLPDLQRVLLDLGGVVNLLLYVTQLDDTRPNKSEDLTVKGINSFFGPKIWRQAVVVFTHAQALPPDDLDYYSFLRGRRDAIWQIIANSIPYGCTIHTRRRGEGPNDLSFARMNAPQIALAETSPQCPTDDLGQKLLPSGEAWLPELYSTLHEVIKETSRPIPPGEDDLEEVVDERLKQWRETEEVLPIEMDSWYMEDRPDDDAELDGGFVIGGYKVGLAPQAGEGIGPLGIALSVFLVVYLLSSLTERWRSHRAVELEQRRREEREKRADGKSLVLTLEDAEKRRREIAMDDDGEDDEFPKSSGDSAGGQSGLGSLSSEEDKRTWDSDKEFDRGLKDRNDGREREQEKRQDRDEEDSKREDLRQLLEGREEVDLELLDPQGSKGK